MAFNPEFGRKWFGERRDQGGQGSEKPTTDQGKGFFKPEMIFPDQDFSSSIAWSLINLKGAEMR